MKADDESFTGIDGLIKTVPTPKKTLAEKRQDAFDWELMTENFFQ